MNNPAISGPTYTAVAGIMNHHGATAVYSTHDQAEAFALVDRVGVLDQGHLVQFDAPEAVYEHPATEFVARFTGLAGELDGTVIGFDGPTVTVEVGQDRVHGRLLSGRRVARGQRVRLLVRPSGVRLAGHGERKGAVSAMAGVVRDAAFRGWGYEHAVEVAGSHQFAGVPAPSRLPVAQRVELELVEAGCLVAPTGAEPPDSPDLTERAASLPGTDDYERGAARRAGPDCLVKDSSRVYRVPSSRSSAFGRVPALRRVVWYPPHTRFRSEDGVAAWSLR